MLHCVMMAGGVGTRFWPLSRPDQPKQFLSMTGGRSLIQSAYDLVRDWIPAGQIWVVTNQRFVKLTQEHLPAIPFQQILQEPCGRNTAPCIGLAALCLQAIDPDAVMLVMSADHVISPEANFRNDVELGLELIEEDPEQLVLFGVPPTFPSTGFGYIERSGQIRAGAFHVEAFREKPDRATAEFYLRDGRFFWNCGIFLWKASRILQLLKEHEPDLFNTLDQLRPHINQPTWNAQLSELFPQLKSISIDYAVLEREKNIGVVEASFSWDDVGSWEAVQRLFPADADGNTTIGRQVGIDTKDCILYSSNDHLIATLGVDGLVIVHTPDATLVARRDDEAGLRRLLAAIEAERGEAST